jgi:hypothetical protein
MKTYGEVDLYNHFFLNLVLVGGEWSASRLCRFAPQGKIHRCPFDSKLRVPQSRFCVDREVDIFNPTGIRTPTHPLSIL